MPIRQGQSPDTEIGRVYVYDLDDWDLPDKKFYWENLEHTLFKLDEDTGMIYMKSGTHDGRYHLRFKVYDRKHTQTDVPANVTVTVKTIPHEAVLNSGSVRISGITDEDFIRVWDYKVSILFRQSTAVGSSTFAGEERRFTATIFSRKPCHGAKQSYSARSWRIC